MTIPNPPQFPLVLSGAPAVRMRCLSDAQVRLLALPEERQKDLKVLELLIAKDPVAMARVLALADEEAHIRDACRGVSCNPLRVALGMLGGLRVRDELLRTWTCDVSSENTDVKDAYVRQHIFSELTTAKKLLMLTSQTLTVCSFDLVMLILLDKLALTGACQRKQWPACATPCGALHELIPGQRHFMHKEATLRPWFAQSLDIAKQWKVHRGIQDLLAELSNWDSLKGHLSPECQLVILAEMALDAAVHGESPEDMAMATEHFPLMSLIEAKRVPFNLIATLF